MKRKRIFPVTVAELEALPTRQLLARLRRLRECEESLAFSDRDEAHPSGSIEFKQSPQWVTAYRDLKQVLSRREHVSRGHRK